MPEKDVTISVEFKEVETVTPPTGDEGAEGGTTVEPPTGDTGIQDDTAENDTIVTLPTTEEETDVKLESKPVVDAEKDKTSDIPQTGDNIVLYIALALVSITAIMAVKKSNKSKGKH